MNPRQQDPQSCALAKLSYSHHNAFYLSIFPLIMVALSEAKDLAIMPKLFRLKYFLKLLADSLEIFAHLFEIFDGLLRRL